MTRMASMFFAFVCTIPVLAEPLGTTITYQGELEQSGSSTNGFFDFQFELFDASADGLSVGGPLLVNDLEVLDGLFTAELDFGLAPFDGDAVWLEISVREGADEGGYTVLSPRQPVRPAPYALRTLSVPDGAVVLGPDAAQGGASGNSLIHLDETGGGTPNLLELEVGAQDIFVVGNSGQSNLNVQSPSGGLRITNQTGDSGTPVLQLSDGVGEDWEIEFERAGNLIAQGSLTGTALVATTGSVSTNAGSNLTLGAPLEQSVLLNVDGNTVLSASADGVQIGPGLAIGSGALNSIAAHFSGTATDLSSASIAAQSCGDYGTVTVTGASFGDTVVATPDASSSLDGIEDNNLMWNAVVSAADTVTIRACNPMGIAIDTSDDQEWRADVWQH